MARVFLSYDREDGAKAKAIAEAIERAGHFVWWDLHIKGGAEYGKVIEQALGEADAVVVLWSPSSVDSAWVRDEAAAGRDSGRLIPVLLDLVSPPIGFRQYQNIDLSRWKGRQKPPLQDIFSAIDGLTGKKIHPPPKARPAAPAPSGISRMARLALISAIVSAALALAYFLVNGPARDDTQTVAVTAADVPSKPLARELLVSLASLQSAKSGTLRLLGPPVDSADQPDLVFETAGPTGNGRIGANLVLMSGADRSILWSKDFEQKSGKLADLKLQMAFTAGRVLGCALDGLKLNGDPLDQQTFKLYLNGCAQLAETAGGDPSRVVQILRQVVKEAPRFEAAWRHLLLAESENISANRANVSDADPRLRKELKQHIAVARGLNPEMAEATLAEAELLPPSAHQEVLNLLDTAKRQEPENSWVLIARGNGLRSVGRMDDGIEDSRRAAELDPLSPSALNAYISALAYSGRVAAARTELQRAERLWPGTETLREVQFRFYLRFGSPTEALNMLGSVDVPPGVELFLRARAEPTKANVDRLIEFMRGRVGKLGLTAQGTSFRAQALGEFHKEDELYRDIFQMPASEDLSILGDIFFRPALKKFRQDPRFMLVAKRAGLLDYWRKSGEWPDFCFDADQPYDCKKEAAKIAG